MIFGGVFYEFNDRVLVAFLVFRFGSVIVRRVMYKCFVVV